MSDTIFGKITRGEIPSDFLYEDDQCVVIRDISPQAPTHVLVIPRTPIPRLVDADVEHQALLGHLMLVVGRVAQQLGVGDGFRLVVNNGEDGGQTVFHLHLHILAGQPMDEADTAGDL
ncbi:histidine triad nucleotide-binding protein 2 [Luminiphilus syltensis NOR5-1B]|uniref:Histidine triad nucleotide-binding protein 2 n=1 Tax=Luminiphilus syltensis NOR5-1B TaxID=565045 RepID=B8KY72_9GAMM|nr:histidine triad nucleotide-binding protein [Luminiphilus syltensis]EED34222.1 histidine triad nucleotide-binding protein 2 [Luminiphilus syltensis NOR5-1B]